MNNKLMNKFKISLLKVLPLMSIEILMIHIMDLGFNVFSGNYLFIKVITVWIVELIIINCIFSVFLSLFKNGKSAITALGITLYVLEVLSAIKYMYTSEPLLFDDVLYLNSFGEIGTIISNNFANMLWKIILVILIEGIFFVILIFPGRVFTSTITLDKLRDRSIVFVISIAILIGMFYPFNNITKFMKHSIYLVDERKDYHSIVNSSSYFCEYGLLGGMYGRHIENRISVPDNYDDEKVEWMLNNAVGLNEKILGKPNIIVVFSESFWDISQLEELEFNKPVTENFNRLKQEGLFFNMISPTYGGISANVEFEFLTGANLMFFGKGFVPYMQLYNNSRYFNRPSIINELKNNGYYTSIFAPTSKELFNCERFYNFLGVDETRFIEDDVNVPKKGFYVSDEYMTDVAIEKLKNKPDNQKLFYMFLTMQAHMPYTINKYSEYDIDIKNTRLTKDAKDCVVSYSQGIYDADKELGRLYDFICQYDEPTIIVFYGDHLPYLQTDKENVIDKLEYFNTPNELLNEYRKYNTQALILANFDIKNEDSIYNYMGPDLLGAFIINNLDINISNYYKWLYDSIKYTGASNISVTIDQNGKIYNTSLIESGKIGEKLKERQNIQYKMFIK